MRNFLKKIFFLILFSSFLYFMLFHSKNTIFYARQGLLVWFQTMIPTLLPFMIITSMMIQLEIHRTFVKILYPFFQKIFQVNIDSIYCVLFGFLCGFPMGARITAQLYEHGYLSQKESSYLLSFCNNIGPIYFISIVLPGIRPLYHTAALLGMYGIPLCYGILLRYTVYGNMRITSIGPATYSNKKQSIKQKNSFFLALDDSITSSLNGITMLGGYMIFFNLCTSIPAYLLGYFSWKAVPTLFFNCFLEISSGIQNVIGARLPVEIQEPMLLGMVMFGGICCLAQTISCIRNMKISIFPYCIHKMIQSILFCIYMKFVYNVL